MPSAVTFAIDVLLATCTSDAVCVALTVVFEEMPIVPELTVAPADAAPKPAPAVKFCAFAVPVVQIPVEFARTADAIFALVVAYNVAVLTWPLMFAYEPVNAPENNVAVICVLLTTVVPPIFKSSADKLAVDVEFETCTSAELTVEFTVEFVKTCNPVATRLAVDELFVTCTSDEVISALTVELPTNSIDVLTITFAPTLTAPAIVSVSVTPSYVNPASPASAPFALNCTWLFDPATPAESASQ